MAVQTPIPESCRSAGLSAVWSSPELPSAPRDHWPASVRAAEA